MRQISVSLGEGYPIYLENGLLEKTGPLLSALKSPCRVALICDETAYSLYGPAVTGSLSREGFTVYSLPLPASEKSKDLRTYEEILYFLAGHDLTRGDLLLAMGGDIIGDVAGFAAATYRRGMPFAQIPTTLLSMIDSSVGGKNGVNLPGHKNLAGSFYQPLAVFSDPSLLKTLRDEELKSGLGELIKYAVLDDPALFDRLEKEDDIRSLAADEALIAGCLSTKIKLIEDDEKDRGSRRLLNLGHSFGHAAEVLSGYSLPHGCAVGCGLALITRAAVKRKLCPSADGERILNLLKKHGFSLNAPWQAEEIASAMSADKKADQGLLPLIVPRLIGHCEIIPLKREEIISWVRDAIKE